jgi:superfamily I DNA/RNA helicase
VDPEQILVLTFRREAADLGTRITRTIRGSPARTFHSYAYGVLRRAALLRGDVPPRPLTSAEQDADAPSCSAATPRRRATATRPGLPGR